LIVNKQTVRIVLVLVLLIALVFILFYFYNINWANQELKRIAFEETKGIDSDQNKAIALAKWIRSNLKAKSNEKNPEMVFLTGSGDCVGLSNVFVLMANSIGLPSRKVGTMGERHYWAEFFTNGQWLNIDPFNDVNGNSVGNFDFYSTWDQPFGKRFSYVYYETGNGEKRELTQKYIETGRLIVVVTENNIPISARVLVKSHHLMELDQNKYKQPELSFFEVTNNSGILDKNFGSNNYTIVVEKDILPFLPPVFVLKSQKELFLDRNTVQTVNFDLENGFELGISELVLDSILIIGVYVIIGYFVFQVCNLLNNRRN